MLEELARLREQQAAQQKQIAELGWRLAAYQARAGVTNIETNIERQTNIETNVERQHITINVFGCENFDHLRNEFPRSCQAYYDKPDGLPLALAQMMYSDSNHPENITAYIPNVKNPATAMYHTERGWEKTPTAKVLGDIATMVCDQIDEQDMKAFYNDQLTFGRNVITPARRKAVALEKNPNEYRPLLERNKGLVVAGGA